MKIGRGRDSINGEHITVGGDILGSAGNLSGSLLVAGTFYGTPGSLLDSLRDVLEVIMISMRRRWAVGAVRDERQASKRWGSGDDLSRCQIILWSIRSLVRVHILISIILEPDLATTSSLEFLGEFGSKSQKSHPIPHSFLVVVSSARYRGARTEAFHHKLEKIQTYNNATGPEDQH